MQDVVIRNIQERDNAAIAKIIRDALTEFGANKPGTVYYDQSTDHLSKLFSLAGSTYFIADANNQVVGGAGIFPTDGLPEGVCELVKMYIKAEVRGFGLGKLLIEKCLQFAKDSGYSSVYLETMPELKLAVSVYEKFGFKYLSSPIGNTGHFGCDVWMVMSLR